MRKLLSVLACSLLSAACASAPPLPSGETKKEEHAALEVAASPAEKCLALAGAQREAKAGQPEKIGVRHVLVKYQGAKNAAAAITRSRGDACLRALEARDKMLGGADFDAIVTEYSDEPGAADRRGSVGTIERKDVAPAFADAAFELAIGQMSDVVETPFGFHLILRNE